MTSLNSDFRYTRMNTDSSRTVALKRAAPKKIVLPVKSRNFRPIHPSGDSVSSGSDNEEDETDYHRSAHYRKLAVEGGPLELGRQLRNLLKLPKAYKWCVYEWFYSSIDRVLLKSENDFQICLKDSFPDLHTRTLSRFQWRKIRKLLGKPRRCSQVFLFEERRALQKKRAKIRWLQLKRPADPINFRDVPNKIPKSLFIGDHVTAYLYQSSEVQSGLYSGTVEAIDIATNLYRISFPRLGIGSFWISDAEVWCPEKYEPFPLDTFMDAKRQITLNKPGALVDLFKPDQTGMFPNDPRIATPAPSTDSAPTNPGKVIESGAIFGGFPIKFLGILVHITKLLGRKKYLIDKLNCENTRAEEIVSRGNKFALEYQEKYANILLELESINLDLNTQFDGAAVYAKGLTPSSEISQNSTIAYEVKSRCEETASLMVERAQTGPITEQSQLLITKLTSLMLQLKCMADGELRAFETKPMNETLAEVKSSLNPTNHNLFQRDVEVNINHIQSSLNLFGSLHVFSSSQ